MNQDLDQASILTQLSSDYEKIKIDLACRNVDASKLVCHVYMEEGNKPRKRIYGSRVTQTHHGHASFDNYLIIDYFLGYRQKILIELHDAGREVYQCIGRVQTTVGQILSNLRKGTIKKIVNNGQIEGEMLLHGEKMQQSCQHSIEFDLLTRNLDVGSSFLCFGLGDASWRLYKIKNSQELLLYKSQVKTGKNNQYQHFKITKKKLCNNNPTQPIILRFRDGSHMIGQAFLNLATLQKGKRKFTLMKQGQEKGIAIMENYKEQNRYDLLDYLSAGMKINMMIGIDFTASNGVYTEPTSLHYHTADRRSQYEEAFHQIASIVMDYSTDKKMSCFGFGAKVSLPNLNTENKVLHCFPLNCSEGSQNLSQILGIEEEYRKCLPYLQFSGPTYFSSLLSQAMEVCKNMKIEQKEYMILLILTDGICHDIENFLNELIKCYELPLSVIVVGIGNGDVDWSPYQREFANQDMQMMNFKETKTVRSLTQFASFQRCKDNGVELGSHVLGQLSMQVKEYHQLCDLTPDVYKQKH